MFSDDRKSFTTDSTRVSTWLRVLRLGVLLALPLQTAFATGPLCTQQPAATVVVTTVTDGVSTCSSDGVGNCSLRDAIAYVNCNTGADTIKFNIPGGGPQTISLVTPLPDITDSVTIDGYTQTGSSANTSTQGSNATLLIQLNGSGIPLPTPPQVANGITLRAGASLIRGLAISGFPGDNNLGTTSGNGILITGGSHAIAGNFIGLNGDGTVAKPNGGDGIYITSSDNLIGGADAASKNVVANSGFTGISMSGIAATKNRVHGNLVGTNPKGNAAIANGAFGVYMNSAPGNTVGGSAAGAGNVISGNGGAGVRVNATGSIGNAIQGNFIGVGADGSLAIPNGSNAAASETAGISVRDAPNTLIGGTEAGARNVISATPPAGILIRGAGATGAQILGNFVGTDATGTSAVPAAGSTDGVVIVDATDSQVGGTTGGARNVISGNTAVGVVILTGAKVQVRGNFIGTDVSGTKVLANGGNQLRVSGGTDNVIGGTAAGAANVVAFNKFNGVVIANQGNAVAQRNRISANTIFGTGKLAIDLGPPGPDGVTQNDAGDVDAGPNGLQNFPALTSASNIVIAGSSVTRIQGTLNSLPNVSYALEFFASDTCGSTGVAQANQWVGATGVTTDASGNASFSVDTFAQIPIGKFATATATHSSGDTSELSACIAIAGPGEPTLTSSQATSAVGEAVVLSSMITPVTGRPFPTGSVTFLDGTTALGTVTLSANAEATLTTSALERGSHSLTAVYSGDSNYSASTSIALTQTVKAMPSVVLTAVPFPLVIGQPVALTATVTNTNAPVPTGNVSFRDGAQVLAANVALDANGNASFTTAALAPGNHFLSASYGGDANNLAVESAAVTQIKAGDVVITRDSDFRRLFASVISRGPTPGGSVTFKSGNTILATLALADGRAEIDIPAGAVAPFTVEYGGDPANGYAAATSNPLSDNVEANDVVLAALPVGGSTDTVVAAATILSGFPTPTGTVEFFDNDRPVGKVNVAAGAAALQLKLGPGRHKLSAKYSGDRTYFAAVSNFGDVNNASGGGGSGGGCTFARAQLQLYDEPLLALFLILSALALARRRVCRLNHE